jgi:uncharacterized protein YbjQ (UPF0145 family)
LAVDDDSTLEDGHEAAEETSEGEDHDYTFRAPSRTPLSQMIAAAQSVVSSVQGDRSEDGEDVDESSTPDDEPHFAEAAHTEEQPAAEGIEAEPIDVPSYVAPVHAAGDDDLPEEPPSWMIIDAATEGEPSDAPLDIEASIADLATPETPEVPFAEDRFEMPGEQEPEREDDFGVVDLDSAPGVYSELHDLDGQDEQAEILLQEAAEAFGRTDPITIEPIEEATEDLFEEPIPAPEDIDSYADALAAQLGADQPTIEPIEEIPEDLFAPDQAGLVDSGAAPNLGEDALGAVIAGLAEAFPEDDQADQAESDEPTEPEEPAAGDWWETESDEPIEEVAEDVQEADQTGVVDSGAAPFLSEDETEAALTGITDAAPEDDLGESVGSEELTEAEEPVAPGSWSTETSNEPAESEGPTEPEEPAPANWWETEPHEPIEEVAEDVQEADQAGVVDSGAAPFLSEDELEAALAGITDAAAEDDLGESVELTEAEQPVAAGWWESETTDDQDAPLGESVEAIASVDDQETMDVVAPVAWDEPADHQDESTKLDHTSAEAQEAAAVIDSPVEWGTRYREAHQGWVEDDEGRSTWRPIVTSGESVAGWDIDIYLGLVSGDISIDPVSTDAVASEVAAAREGAVRRMLDEGLARGAHAIVGVTFSIQDVGGIVLVGASGVAVTLRTPA